MTSTPIQAPPPPTSPAKLPAPPRHAGNDAGNGNGFSHAQHAHQGPVAMDEHDMPKDLHRPGNMTVIVVVLIFVALLAGIFVVGYIPHRHRVAEAEADATDRTSMPLVVDVTRPKVTTTSKDVLLPGDLRPMQETALFPRVTGYLKSFSADIGDHVKAGTVLAVIDSPDIDAQLAQNRANLGQARAAVDKAQADLDNAKTTLDRYEAWNKASAGVSQKDLDDKRAAYKDAVADLSQMKANVLAAEATVQQTSVMQEFEKIIAPFDGTITERTYDKGALLNTANTTAKEMFRIDETDVLRVFVNVPQTYATAIKTDQPAYLTVRNYPGREFKGTISRSAGALDESTRTMSFELHFPNPDGALAAGMYGEARLPVTNEAPVLVIPTSALVFNAAGLKIAVARDGKIHLQKITVGRDLGTEIEVTAGISADDQVVTNPGERLAEGVAVEISGGDQPGAPAPSASASAK